MTRNKVALIILDGWGLGDGSSADAISTAKTPCFDGLMNRHPHCTLKTFGEHVGLPHGQMGNSEVGHLNIGAGRIVYQDLARINKAIADGELEKNEVLQKAIAYAREHEVPVHLMGLVSHGGVHSSQEHLHALIDVLEKNGVERTYIHAFTDGRDTEPRNAVDCISELTAFLRGKGAKLVSMIGRYYAMDRDKRWERIKKAYDLLLYGEGNPTDDFVTACRTFYDQDVTDEFFLPTVIGTGTGRIEPGDVVICFNFRTDRCRQITTALTQQDLEEWEMHTLPLHYVTMARYDESFKDVHVLFEKDNLHNTLGEVLSRAGLKQLRIAETEKYPHVTFFFSGGREEPFAGEMRAMAHSPKVATYDLKPEMSAEEVADLAVRNMVEEAPDFLCLNFANPDMVGHTGVYAAIIKAVETTDKCLERVMETATKQGYDLLVIADHGNADITRQPDGTPHTAHTLNLVPCILIAKSSRRLRDGILADVAPTVLELMGITQPGEMTGRSLLV